MAQTFKNLRNDGDAALAKGKTLVAFSRYQIILEHIPQDFELRLIIGDALLALEKTEQAAAVYLAVAVHDTKSGNPLRAMAAVKRLSSLGFDVSPVLKTLSTMYAFGSGVTGTGLKPAPVDYEAPIPKKAGVDREWNDDELLETVGKTASNLDGLDEYPRIVPPVALFSRLPRDSFLALFEKLELEKYNKGDAIVRQGDVGDAIYFIARGEVSVERTDPDGDDGEKTTRLARLGPGSLFGEMALVSTDTRSASVICESRTDALMLAQSDIAALSEQIEQIAEAMNRFTQERLIANLFATNPIFEHFDEDSQKKLLARFTGHDVPTGTIFLEQGATGQGLYIILRGKAEVLKWVDDAYTKVAELGPGDVAGEISLLFEEPVTATVRTTTSATLLFLARELFTPIVESIPELLAFFNKLANERSADTEFKMMSRKVVDDDYVDELEELDDVSMDDVVLI